MNFESLTIKGLKDLYQKKIINFKELIELQISYIDKTEKKIFSLVNFDEDIYLKKANELDTLKMSKEYLGNIPIGVKDLIDIKGFKTEANSKSLAGNIAKNDADIVSKLKHAGAFVAMKTNTHEYAYGAVTPPTRNPWDSSKIPGGSSGGSAAATSSGIVLASLGSDTAGSIREPAALCSVVGFKPTYNWTSLTGVVPLAWSLDVVGPITKTITDCATIFKALSTNYLNEEVTSSENKYKLGILSEYFSPMQQKISNAYLQSIENLETCFECERVSSWDVDEVISTIFIILTSESAAFLYKEIEKNPNNFGGDVKEFVNMGNNFSSVDYINAQRARKVITNRVDDLFNRFDFLIGPAQLIEAPSADQEILNINGKDLPRDINLIKPLVLSSLCGYPAISIPFVEMESKNFFSIQVIGKRNSDNELMDFSKLLEKEFNLQYVNPLN
jgi:aspartyl-tRNA(Asn)/glutamyl-tRNA(Gln) amidotransferase subunit A